MRDGGLGEGETLRELGDVETLTREDGDDLLTCRVRQSPEAVP
jgi:hypothetical protein